MKKVLSTLIAGSAVAATSMIFGSTEAMAVSFTFSECTAPDSSYDISGNVTGAHDCTISNKTQDFTQTDPLTVNEDGGFFGMDNWMFAGKIGEDEGYDGLGEGESGSYDFTDVYMPGHTYMLVFKSGAGTFLTGYKLNDGVTSGTWDSPFVEPPFSFPGNGPKDVSHISVYKKPVPEPLTILGAGAAISFGTAFKRKLGQAKKNDKNA